MTRFLVEVYAPAASALDEAVGRARSAADSLLREGIPVRHLSAIHVPADETAFHLFEAPSSDAAGEASRRAGLASARIVEALDAGELAYLTPDASGGEW